MGGFDASSPDTLRVEVGGKTEPSYGWQDYAMAPFNYLADGMTAASRHARYKVSLLGNDLTNLGQYVFEHRKSAAAVSGCIAAGYYSAFTECPAGAELAAVLMEQLDHALGVKSGEEASLIVKGRLDLRDKEAVNDSAVPLLVEMLKGQQVGSVDVRHTKLTSDGVSQLSEMLGKDHPGVMVISDQSGPK
jgi:hypothetical protein